MQCSLYRTSHGQLHLLSSYDKPNSQHTAAESNPSQQLQKTPAFRFKHAQHNDNHKRHATQDKGRGGGVVYQL